MRRPHAATAALVVATLAAAAVEAVPAQPDAATQRVTLEVDTTLPRWGQRTTVSGTVPSSRAGEIVTIEVKECGPHAPYFREYTSARTSEGGRWRTETFFRTTSAIRARWGDATSEPMTVRSRPGVLLQRDGGRFGVSVVALSSFWRRHVVVERFAPKTGRWVFVKRVVLTESGGGGTMSWTSAKFRAKLPRRTLIRAVLPLSQARPCYMAGYSNLFRT